VALADLEREEEDEAEDVEGTDHQEEVDEVDITENNTFLFYFGQHEYKGFRKIKAWFQPCLTSASHAAKMSPLESSSVVFKIQEIDPSRISLLL